EPVEFVIFSPPSFILQSQDPATMEESVQAQPAVCNMPPESKLEDFDLPKVTPSAEEEKEYEAIIPPTPSIHEGQQEGSILR
ncbi:hypothetical protein KI387_003016, partial [Taxus chinensis]